MRLLLLLRRWLMRCWWRATLWWWYVGARWRRGEVARYHARGRGTLAVHDWMGPAWPKGRGRYALTDAVQFVT